MISHSIKKLKALNLEVLLGIELEFYSSFPKEAFKFRDVILKDEIGKGQIEAIFLHNKPLLQVLKDTILFRNNFRSMANFNAVVRQDLPPSSMQLNFSILSKGKNILNENIIYFVLEETKKNMQCFAPTENCKLRLKNLDSIKEFRNSPYTFSVGSSSNRTSAIRIRDGYFEHRLPSPSCILLQSCNVILQSIIMGFESKKNFKITQIHANAFEKPCIEQFGLEIISSKLMDK